MSRNRRVNQLHFHSVEFSPLYYKIKTIYFKFGKMSHLVNQNVPGTSYPHSHFSLINIEFGRAAKHIVKILKFHFIPQSQTPFLLIRYHTYLYPYCMLEIHHIEGVRDIALTFFQLKQLNSNIDIKNITFICHLHYSVSPSRSEAADQIVLNYTNLFH